MANDDLEIVCLETPSKSLSLSLVPGHGLTFNKLVANGYDVLIGPEEPKCLKSEPRKFNNQIVGRYANRLPAGKFEILDTIIEKPLVMDIEEASPGVYLHGGKKGFDQAHWHRIPKESSELFQKFEKLVVDGTSDDAIFKYYSPANDQGFPRGVLTEVYVAVTEPLKTLPGCSNSVGQLYYNIRAKIVENESFNGTSIDNSSTPINMTIHWGFNLENGETVDNSLLWIESSNVNVLDSETSLATGEIKDIRNGKDIIYDFTSPRAIGAGIPDNGFDDNFLLDMEKVNAGADVVKLGSLGNPINLSFSTNQSSVMCYTGGFNDGSGTRKKCHGDIEAGYEKLQTIFLEFQHPVGTLLHKTLQDHARSDTLLRPGELYENWVRLNVKDMRLS